VREQLFYRSLTVAAQISGRTVVRFTDLLSLAFSALRQQKVRTFLTLLGVVIGTFVLLLSLSIGQGVRETIVREFHRNDELRRIVVFPHWRVKAEDIPPDALVLQGAMSEERRERLRQALVQRWRGETKRSPQKILNAERLDEFAALDHVAAVVPQIQGNARVHFRNKIVKTMTCSASVDERSYRQRLVAGSFFTAEQPRGLVVNEYLLYRLGIHDEADVARAVGSEMVLDYSSPQGNHWSVASLLGVFPEKVEVEEEDVLGKIATKLTAAIDRLDLTATEKETLRKVATRKHTPRARPTLEIREAFTLVGVVRDFTAKERREMPWIISFGSVEADVLVPEPTLRELYFRDREDSVYRATILVDDEDNVEAVEEQIRILGFEAQSLAAVLKNLRLNVLLITFATTFVALVALVVAGLGITNTLLMSVLERTHEIGVMKAVGARERHIQLLFLLEGAWIGLLGSALGLLFGWLASIPGDRIAHRLAEQQAQTELSHSLFVFPWWLVLGVPLFVTLLTLLAALYPARRAARVNAMTALRHE
jgi:putative ABC transport system permease protein